jgi:hypothetical protein
VKRIIAQIVLWGWAAAALAGLYWFAGPIPVLVILGCTVMSVSLIWATTVLS